jgi:hypothetical protein
MGLRCIFCKKDSSTSRSVEHILPESLGNEEHILPPGIVCDRCNNYFASSVEQAVLESGYFATSRFYGKIPNKRGRIPSLPGILLPCRRQLNTVRFHKAGVSQDGDGGLYIDADGDAVEGLATGNITSVIIPATGPPPASQLFSRFLGKMAVESLAQRVLGSSPDLLAELTDHPQLDLLRNYSRFGKVGLDWPYSERQIYPRDFRFPAENDESYEVLHEWTFLYMESMELYFVVAIFGVEYAINVGGPTVEGYDRWLREKGGRSPLYEGSILS